MEYNAQIRAFNAAQRRKQREAQKRYRELERQAKEHDKLTAIAIAQLAVETFENQLEVLLSVHKEQGPVWDWTGIVASLPKPCPQRHSYHEQKARQRAAIVPPQVRERSQGWLEQAQLEDEQDFQNAMQVYAEEMAQLERLKSLAQRIRAGEHKAYTEALVELNPFAEMSELGSAIHFTVHTAKLAECVLKVNGRQAIPAEVKTLTSSGKVSVKPMPKSRFHEIYQDYICGCVLRVAREIFALLPVTHYWSQQQRTHLIHSPVKRLSNRFYQCPCRAFLWVNSTSTHWMHQTPWNISGIAAILKRHANPRCFSKSHR